MQTSLITSRYCKDAHWLCVEGVHLSFIRTFGWKDQKSLCLRVCLCRCVLVRVADPTSVWFCRPSRWRLDGWPWVHWWEGKEKMCQPGFEVDRPRARHKHKQACTRLGSVRLSCALKEGHFNGTAWKVRWQLSGAISKQRSSHNFPNYDCKNKSEPWWWPSKRGVSKVNRFKSQLIIMSW